MSSIERTLSAPIAGPVVLDLTMPSGLIDITVTDTDRAEITLTTDAPTDSRSARAITAATASTDARVMTVHVPTPEHDGMTVINTSGGRTIITGNATSGIVVSGGTVYVSGMVVNNAAGTGALVSSGVRASVRLPRGSALRMDTKSGQVTAFGELEWIDFTAVSGRLDAEACGKLTASTTSGDVRAEYADNVTARTVSGDIRMGRTETAVLSSTSGDITIADFGGGGRLTTVSGDITVAATEGGHLTASSTSGDITVTAPADLVASNALTVNARSISGDVRTPRPPAAPARPRRPRRAP